MGNWNFYAHRLQSMLEDFRAGMTFEQIGDKWLLSPGTVQYIFYKENKRREAEVAKNKMRKIIEEE